MENIETITVQEAETHECRHHWVIETPHGAMSSGLCKFCGARKEFFNSSPGAMWEDDARPGAGNRWGRSKPAAIAMDEEAGISAADSETRATPALV